jgi:hypothetical protein
MKFWSCAYIFAFISLISSGCRKDKEIEERYTWSSDSPLTIPYRARIQRLEKTNLIRNYSFETGRTFTINSNTSSFVIDGWQLFGQHVQWVDTRNDSLFDADEAFSGYRAIKITREKAYETDERGDGVISDFIKVIPGNYSLSLYARLYNVFPNKARLGTKMFDGVDIKVLFYDRNKIPIQADYNFPQFDQIINTSFKGLSFSNFNNIPSFGWGKIIGKSHSFPFPEGDIPSEAHFVKISIGLKGTGTLWVDSIAYNYTDKNFSVAERMQKYTDTAFFPQVSFIPEPKSVDLMEAIVYYKDGMKIEQMPVIVVHEKNDHSAMRAAQLIQQTFQKYLVAFGIDSKHEIPVLSDVSKIPSEPKLIISLGKTNFYNDYLKFIPINEIKDKPQGYIIYTPADRSNLVILEANDDKGLFYAATTAIQMLDHKTPVFHNARIIDYPDFGQRFCTIDNKSSASGTLPENYIRELVKYKLNGVLLLNDGNPAITSEPDLFDFIPVSGYVEPGATTLSYKYPLQFESRLETAFSKYIIPPVFHNQMLDNSNYLEVRGNIPMSATVIYSGSSFFSLMTDDADIDRFSSVMGVKPVFMDNSMKISTPWAHYGANDGYFPGKIRLFNIFEPYSNTGIRDIIPKVDTSLFVINQTPTSEIDIIRLATAADFMWNSSSYSKDFALWKVLVSRYGVENARDLIIYAEKVGLMLEIILKLEMNIQVVRNVKSAQQVMTELTKQLSDIGYSLGTQNPLVKELQKVNADLRNRLNQQVNKIPVKK